MVINNFKSGCVKQKADPRDHPFRVKLTHWTRLNDIDLRPGCMKSRKQGNISSCTGFAATALFDFVRRKQDATKWLPSPLFTYYVSRAITNSEQEDAGATVKDALKSTAQYGVCTERAWPYKEKNYNMRPPEEAFVSAEKHQSLEYMKIDDFDKNVWLNCLNDGFPFVFGLNLYTSFLDPVVQMMGGFMPEPDRDNEKMIGGHCMLAVGWIRNHNNKEYLIAQNSWGVEWGDKGYCYIPLSYIMSNDSFDFWTIRLTETSSDDVDDPTTTPAPEPTPVEIEPTVAPTPPEVVNIQPTTAPTPVVPSTITQPVDVVVTKRDKSQVVVTVIIVVVVAALVCWFLK